jgi:hypothetical protein
LPFHFCIETTDHSPELAIVTITPNTGPTIGGTEVEIVGTGIRDFASLMTCRYASDHYKPTTDMKDSQCSCDPFVFFSMILIN